jgi:REP element-mobilizing transposase RayT
VRRAFLLGEGPDDRKKWVENRLEELAEVFAISVGGFSLMDNHLHVLVRLDQGIATNWSGRRSRAAMGTALAAAEQMLKGGRPRISRA